MRIFPPVRLENVVGAVSHRTIMDGVSPHNYEWCLAFYNYKKSECSCCCAVRHRTYYIEHHLLMIRTNISYRTGGNNYEHLLIKTIMSTYLKMPDTPSGRYIISQESIFPFSIRISCRCLPPHQQSSPSHTCPCHSRHAAKAAR